MAIDPDKQYPLLLELRREESTRFWTVFSLMSAINGGLLAFSKVGFRDPKIIPVCVFGVVLCLVWSMIQKRFRFWVRKWEEELKNLEDNHNVFPAERRVFGFVDSARRCSKPLKSCFIDGCSTKDWGTRLPDLFVVVWISLAIVAFFWPLQAVGEGVSNLQVDVAQISSYAGNGVIPCFNFE